MFMAGTSDLNPFPFVIGFFALCGVVAAVWYVLDKRNKKERKLKMTAFAARYKLTLYEDMDTPVFTSSFGSDDGIVGGSVVGNDLCRMLASFSPLDRGYSKVVTNAATGETSVGTLYMFDYKVTTGSKDDSETNDYGIVAFRVPYHFSKIVISPADVASLLLKGLVRDRVEFESDEFNRQYIVETENRKFAFDILHAQAMSYLLALPRLYWQFNGPYIVLVQDGPFELSTVGQLIPTVQKFIELIPDYVRQDIGITPRWTSLFESAL